MKKLADGLRNIMRASNKKSKKLISWDLLSEV